MNVKYEEDYASVFDSNINVLTCIGLFDAGYDIIYILDSEKKFHGMVIEKDNFNKIWKDNCNNDWITQLDEKQYIYNPISDVELNKKVNNCFLTQNVKEVPIVENDTIIGIARLQSIKYSNVEWDILDNKEVNVLLGKYNTICLSSLLNDNLCNFYAKYRETLNIVILNEANINKFVNGEFGLFVYASNVYIENSNTMQISYEKLYNILFQEIFSDIKSHIYLCNDWASISNENCTFSECIKHYDENYNAICIRDINNNFKSLICVHNFTEDFLNRKIRKWSNLFIEDENHEKNLDKLVSKFFGTNRKELPVIKNNKVSSMAVLGLASQNKRIPMLGLKWDYIDEETINEFMQKYKNILLSSKNSSMIDFYNRFRHILNLSFYEDDKTDNYLNGDYDLLLYRADIWPKIKQTKSIDIYKLYYQMLLSITIKYLQKQSIKYYHLMYTSDFINYANRISEQPETIYLNCGAIEKNGYFVYADSRPEDVYHVIDGVRLTSDMPQNYSNKIAMYGPCTVAGIFTPYDNLTITSYLQQLINNQNMPYRVVNYGIAGIEYKLINSLYRILDTVFQKGDIVINITDELALDNDFCIPYDYIYNMQSPFINKPDVKCFIRGKSMHLDEIGNKILADYIYTIIQNELIFQPISTDNNTPIRFSKKSDTITNNELKKYINTLQKAGFKQKGKKGAIVMNCNPFTLGHKYLIDKSLSLVDYLYIFIVEENRSYFSFEDRFKMVQEYCKKYPNIKVLPSGKYIISSFTFPEYFEKDTLQNVTITPTFDVSIFAQFIAPALDITYRFVGEEPFDRVTAQYNIALKETLPAYGIDLIEIPRYQISGEIISASTVRKCMKEKNIEKLNKFLPATSFEYLKNNGFF